MSTPRSNPNAATSSILARRGPLLLATVAIGATGYFFYAKRPPAPEGTPSADLGTTGVGNIENAYTNAGATSTHTPAYGGTPVGDKRNQNLREDSPAGTGAPKGVKAEGYGDDQRPSDSTKIEKKFQQANYGDEKGK